jgi:DNA-directed RNA polymerase subunit RPC12/RpoP
MPKELTADAVAAIKERELRVKCDRCDYDFSAVCLVSEIQLPMGKNPAGQLVMMSQTSILRPLVCPSCGLSILDKPSPLAIPGH